MKKKLLPLFALPILLLCGCEPFDARNVPSFTFDKDNYNSYFSFSSSIDNESYYATCEVRGRELVNVSSDASLKFQLSFDYTKDGKTTKFTKDISFNLTQYIDTVMFFTKEEGDPYYVVAKSLLLTPVEVSGTVTIGNKYYKKVDLSTITNFSEFSFTYTSFSTINGTVIGSASQNPTLSYNTSTYYVFDITKVDVSKTFYDENYNATTKKESYTSICLDGFVIEPSEKCSDCTVTGITGYLYIY